MEIPDNLVEYVKEEARRIGHGTITIEIIEERGKVDVVTQRRKRFPIGPERDSSSSAPREFRTDS